MTGYLIKHHERFSPFIMAEDSATSSSMADAKVSVLLNGTQGDAGELNAEMLTLCAESDCLCVCVCVCGAVPLCLGWQPCGGTASAKWSPWARRASR